MLQNNSGKSICNLYKDFSAERRFIAVAILRILKGMVVL